MEHLIGKEIKGYQLRELIGTGGFGAVFKAYQPIVNREVALKVILPGYANSPNFIRRFETEAHLVARLEHPYIVPLYDFWRDPEGAYIVMRYLRGGNLSRFIRHDGPLTLDKSTLLLNQIAAALTIAHNSGVVHRDLKPDNILLDESGNFYLSDFGIAKEIEREVDLTQTGTIMGSPAYLSPEQINGDAVSLLADIYSLGILMHYSLSGQHPFPGKTPTAMIVHQLQDIMPAISPSRNDVNEQIDEVLQKATAKNPAERYISAMEFAIAFARASGHMDGGANTSQIQRQFSMASIARGEVSNPYKGLKAFEEADTTDFYGREKLTERLVQRLTPKSDFADGEHLLMVVGPSGSGKSSVVKAGLIPALRRGAVSGSDQWYYIEMVPGAHPMEELEAALLRVAIQPPESLLTLLTNDERGFVRALKRILPDDDTQLVLFIDQFEEVFTLCPSEEERRHFLNSIMSAITEPRNRLRLLITLRADFYDRPLGYHAFGELIRQYTEVVLPLSPEELEAAIVNPSRKVGVALEAGLASAIVSDVADQPGALPLLQYALTQLFDQREGNRLTLAAYQQIGRAMGALARRAEGLYEELTLPQKDAAQQLFLRLVTLGEGTEDTRRRIPRSELNALGDSTAMDVVIQVFGEQRLLTFDNDPQTREPTLEVAHEALIREWLRLRDWLDNAREDLRTQRRLYLATQEWLHSHKESSFLADGARLDQFEALLSSRMVAMNEDERAYLQQSLERRTSRLDGERTRVEREERLEEQAKQRMQALIAVLSVAALVAIALASFAFYAQSQAVRAQANAETAAADARQSASEAQSVAWSASALNLLEENQPDLALALVLEAATANGELTTVKRALAEVVYAPSATHEINPFDETSVIAAAFAPDGAQAILGLADGRVAFINPLDGTVIHEAAVYTTTNSEGATVAAPVNAAAFAGNGQLAATAGNNVITLWNPQTGSVIRTLEGHAAKVNSIALTPDGTRLLSGADDATLYLWDTASGELVLEYPDVLGVVFSVDINGDGTIAVASTTDTPPDADNKRLPDRAIYIFDLVTGELIQKLQPEGVGFVRAVAIQPSGGMLASASYDPNEFGGTIRLWDVESGQLIRRLIGHTDVLTTLDFSPDGQTLLSGGWDRTVRQWDVNTGVQINRFNLHGDRITTVRFSPDGGYALSASGRASGTVIDTRAFRLDLARRDLVDVLQGHDDWVWTAAYSPDGNTIATGSGDLNVGNRDNTVRLWDTQTGEQVATLNGHTHTVSAVAFHPTEPILASSSWDGTVILWDLTSRAEIRRLLGHEGRVNDVAFSPDGTTLVTAGADRTIRLWNLATGELIRTIVDAHGTGVNRARFSPQGDTLASAGRDNLAKLWNVRTGELIHDFVGLSGWVSTVAFSHDGQYVVAGADNDLILWQTANAQEVRRFVGHQGFVYGGQFSPDDDYLLSGASDTTVRLWQVATGEEIRRFNGHTNWVLEVAFSPDGTHAISAAEDDTARIWQIARSNEELLAWATENRYLPAFTCATREQYNVPPLCESLASQESTDREGRSAAFTPTP
ncbi:MAG: protein kinase domain-containing protein [Phototrophicaceae bacterium]